MCNHGVHLNRKKAKKKEEEKKNILNPNRFLQL